MNDFHYDQKEVLLKTVRRHIRVNRAKSLLDIGAGDGRLAIRLANLVPIYAAVEKNKNYVSRLKKAGVSVIPGIFPLKTVGEFDVVLASHSLPEKKNLYKRFLEAAWRKVRLGGILLIITFKGSRGGFAELYKSLYRKDWEADQEMHKEMISILKRLGKVKVEKVTSTIKTRSLDTMIDALLNPLGIKAAEMEKHHARLEKILERKFKSRKGYRFPTPHLVISVRK